MGPDEFHEGYPDAPTPGLNNNAYTNIMAVWVLCRALDVLDLLPDMRRAELMTRLGCPRTRSRAGTTSAAGCCAVSWRRDHQPVRGLREAGGAGLGGLPHAVRQYPAPRSHPRGGERQREPLQALEAGRRADAVLSVFRRGAGRAVHAPGLSVRYETIPRNVAYYDAARPTAPRSPAWCMRGSWRARTGRARCATSRRRCRAT